MKKKHTHKKKIKRKVSYFISFIVRDRNNSMFEGNTIWSFRRSVHSLDIEALSDQMLVEVRKRHDLSGFIGPKLTFTSMNLV